MKIAEQLKKIHEMTADLMLHIEENSYVSFDANTSVSHTGLEELIKRWYWRIHRSAPTNAGQTNLKEMVKSIGESIELNIALKSFATDAYIAFFGKAEGIGSLPSFGFMMDRVREAWRKVGEFVEEKDKQGIFKGLVADASMLACFKNGEAPVPYYYLGDKADELQKRLDEQGSIAKDYYDLKSHHEDYLIEVARELGMIDSISHTTADAEEKIIARIHQDKQKRYTLVKRLAESLSMTITLDTIGWDRAEELLLARVKEHVEADKGARARLQPLVDELTLQNGAAPESSIISQACYTLKDLKKKLDATMKDRDSIVASILPHLPEPKNLTNIEGSVKQLLENANTAVKEQYRLQMRIDGCHREIEQEKLYGREFKKSIREALGADQGHDLLECVKSLKTESDNTWDALRYEQKTREEAEHRASNYFNWGLVAAMFSVISLISWFCR